MIEAYLWAFVNFEQNDWAKLLPIAEFAYNNTKNISTSHTPFELNCRYYFWISYKKEVDLCSKSKLAIKLSMESKELMVTYHKKLYHTQEFHKRANNKDVKPRNYVPSEKVWLNSKYIKLKQNQNLEAKFFRPFQVLHLIRKQAYQLELPEK